MTIAVGVASTSGVVIGADSRTSMVYPTEGGGQLTRSATDFAEKVAILNDLTAAATFGRAGFCGRMMDFHLNRFAVTLASNEPMGEVVPKMSHFFEDLYNRDVASGAAPAPDGGYAAGFLIGGRGEDGSFGLCTLLVPGSFHVVGPLFGWPVVVWQGVVFPLSRLINGVDPRIPLDDQTRGVAGGYGYRLSLGDSLQEMVDFASFAMKLTVDIERFTNGMHIESNGLDGCAAPFDIAVVNDTSSFWVARKDLRVR